MAGQAGSQEVGNYPLAEEARELRAISRTAAWADWPFIPEAGLMDRRTWELLELQKSGAWPRRAPCPLLPCD